MKKYEKFMPLLGRIFLALIFLKSGFGKITGWEGTAGYMSSKGFPLVPVFLLGAILFELGGGLSVLLGYRAKLGALALIIFMVPTTIIFHNFWALEGGAKAMQQVMFMKNLAIIGGLFVVFGLGSGPFSLTKNKS